MKTLLILIALGNPLFDDGTLPTWTLRPCTTTERQACKDSCAPTGVQFEAHSTCSVEYALLPAYREPNIYGPVLYCTCTLEPERPGLVTRGL